MADLYEHTINQLNKIELLFFCFCRFHTSIRFCRLFLKNYKQFIKQYGKIKNKKQLYLIFILKVVILMNYMKPLKIY